MPNERPFRLTLVLRRELHDAVDAAASRQFTRPSEWVRRAIVRELTRTGEVQVEKARAEA